MTPQTTAPTAPAAKTGTPQLDGVGPAPGAWRPDDRLEAGLDGGADCRAVGMPADRLARVAAGRAFVALKLSFLYVVDGLEGHEELKSHVQRAEEPIDLWALRAPVFAALTGEQAHRRSHRQLLIRSLDSMFPAAPPQLN
jgi:hypothetical protein